MFAPDATGSGEGFDPASFRLLESVEPRSFWFRGRNRLIAWALARYFPRAANLLEVGCGTGFVLTGLRERFPNLELVGSELYPEGLEIAQRRLPGVPLYQMDARRIPFEEAFDVVVALDVLEHIGDDDVALGQLAQAARRGGGVIVTVPQHAWLWSAVDEYSKHERRYERAELIAKLREAGLQLVRATSFVTLLLPVMLVARWRHRSGADYDPATEYRLGRRANLVLERVLDAERALIRSGVSLPVGGSLLAIARKP